MTQTTPEDQATAEADDTSSPGAAPVPPQRVRAVARVASPSPKVRATATVLGAIDPSHRTAPPDEPPAPREPEPPAPREPEPDAGTTVRPEESEPGESWFAPTAYPENADESPSKSEDVANPESRERPATGRAVVGTALFGRVAAGDLASEATDEPEPVNLTKASGRARVVASAKVVATSAPAESRAEVAAPPKEPAVITITPEAPPRTAKPGKNKPKKKKEGWRQKSLLPILVGLAAAFTAGTGYLAIKQPALDPTIGRWSGTYESPAPTDAAPFAVSSGGSAADPFGTSASSAALTGAPTRLQVKAAGIDTTLESLKLGTTGELTPPKSFTKAGWYAAGTRPGDVGPAVLAGHVDSKAGPAVFYYLRRLEAGDKIVVTRGGKRLTFTVTSTAWYPKNNFPTDRVYGPTPDRQLRLITCGGVFDRTLRSYKDNFVVYAVAG